MNDGVDSKLSTRLIAFEILEQVLLKKQPLDHMLERHKSFGLLSSQDRGFTRMLIATSLRRKGQIDDLIKKSLDQDKPLQPQTLEIILTIGVTQLLFMDVSDHAAVYETVELANTLGLSKQKGLINAVLRRLGAEGKELIKKQDSVQMNMPHWLLSSWIEDYDLKTAAQIAESSLTEASLDITVRDESLKLNHAKALEASILPTGSLRRSSGGNIVHLPGFDEGQWWVQDASAALPVQLMGDVSGKHIVDLCAAPGGKTAQLAARGAQVSAIDRSAKRLSKLKENMERLGLSSNFETFVSDGAEWNVSKPIDSILLDAPCSATGTIRRHPDVMHLKSLQDVERLQVTQQRLLAHAADILPPGGLLIYCTCSLQKLESEYQVDVFLAQNSNFSRVPIKPEELGGLDTLINEHGDIRVLPFHLAPHGGMDGFFISRLTKA